MSIKGIASAVTLWGTGSLFLATLHKLFSKSKSPFLKTLITIFTFPAAVPYRAVKNTWDRRKTGNLDDISKKELNELLAARNKLKSEFGFLDRNKYTSTPEGRVAHENYQTLNKVIAEIRA